VLSDPWAVEAGLDIQSKGQVSSELIYAFEQQESTRRVTSPRPEGRPLPPCPARPTSKLVQVHTRPLVYRCGLACSLLPAETIASIASDADELQDHPDPAEAVEFGLDGVSYTIYLKGIECSRSFRGIPAAKYEPC